MFSYVALNSRPFLNAYSLILSLCGVGLKPRALCYAPSPVLKKDLFKKAWVVWKKEVEYSY